MNNQIVFYLNTLNHMRKDQKFVKDYLIVNKGSLIRKYCQKYVEQHGRQSFREKRGVYPFPLKFNILCDTRESCMSYDF